MTVDIYVEYIIHVLCVCMCVHVRNINYINQYNNISLITRRKLAKTFMENANRTILSHTRQSYILHTHTCARYSHLQS